MDFGLSHEQEMVVDTVRAFVETELYPLEDEVEPYLLRTGLVIRTPRGRKVTEAGYQHLGWELPQEGESGSRPFLPRQAPNWLSASQTCARLNTAPP